MKYEKINVEFIKRLFSNKPNVQTVYCTWNDGYIDNYLIGDGYIVYIIPVNKCFINFNNAGKQANAFLEKAIKNDELKEDAILTNEMVEYKDSIRGKLLIKKLESTDGEFHTWIDTAFLKYFDYPSFKITARKNNAMIYIYESGELVGVCCPVFRKDEEKHESD